MLLSIALIDASDCSYFQLLQSSSNSPSYKRCGKLFKTPKKMEKYKCNSLLAYLAKYMSKFFFHNSLNN